MKITVKVFTALRELVGKGEITIETNTPKPTIHTILSQLNTQYGKEFTEYIYDENGDIRGFLQFLINGKSITTPKGLKTRLKGGDTIAILPPVGGG
jgi:molybdopterin synthase sulfur carrier subunit